MEKKVDTLALAAEMIRNLGQEDAARAATMAMSLHQHEQLMGRIDRLAETVGAIVAAQAAKEGAREEAREAREARESEARIAESAARTAAEVARDARAAQDHELRLAEIRERHAKHTQQGCENPFMGEVLNRI